jgi:hypothetical protein
MLTRTTQPIRRNRESAVILDALPQQSPEGHALNQTPSFMRSQAKSVMDAIKLPFVDWQGMEKAEHEGKKLERLIADKGYKVADLARAAGLSWPAAKKWVAAEQIGVEARATVIKALDTLGIDPRLMWPPEQRETMDELKSLVQGLDAEVLRRMRQVLLASRGNQQRLVDYIDGRIEAVSHQSAK